MNNRRVYTVQQVAEILQVSTKTIYQIVKDGDLKCIYVRGQIRITSTVLEHYLQGGTHGKESTQGPERQSV